MLKTELANTMKYGGGLLDLIKIANKLNICIYHDNPGPAPQSRLICVVSGHQYFSM